MFVIIIMDNITIHCYNYCLCCYSKYLIFICRGNSLPPPPPPPLALLTAQQELLKIYVSICIIYAIFTCFSNQESV